MNAANAVQLFILVWTFSAVCQDDKDIRVSCDNVTGSVGKEVNLTCFVSLLINECSIKKFMFKYNDLNICCEQVLLNDCEHGKSLTCPYTPTTAMTAKFSFFMQASCGWVKPEFTVDTTGHINPEKPGASQTAVDLGFKDTDITVVVSGLIIILIIIIIMTVIYKTKLQKLQNTKLIAFV